MYDYLKRFFYACRTLVTKSSGRPVYLSCRKNLTKYILLPYSGESSDLISMPDGTIYYGFTKYLSYRPLSGGYTSSHMFGVGEIIPDKNIDYKIHPLPADFPERKCQGYDDWSFSFQTVSGNDLIYSVQEPGPEKNSSHTHYIFCFGTDSRQWSRVESVEKDGTYIKKPVLPETFKNRFLSDSVRRRNYLSEPEQCLYIWSICPGKIRVEKAAHILFDECNDAEYAARSYCIEENAKAAENFKTNIFYDDYDSILDPLKLQKIVTSESGKTEFRTFFHIRGIKKFLPNLLAPEEKKDTEEIIFNVAEAVKFRYDEKDAVGVFINCYIPGGWEKSSFLVFEYE
ncbi:MAG: hypothetical protein AB7S75_13485 [Desulfococcaceae bacterium]